jgi:hypothetical protein
MSHPLLGALLVALASLSGMRPSTPPPAPSARADTTAYGRWFAGLRAARIDATMGADVHNLVLERDEGTLRLTEGRLQLLEPIQGRVYGMVFVGRGSFTLTPPIDAERAHMKRLYGEERFERELRTAVIFFTDWTLDEVGQAVAWQALPPQGDARREVEEALAYVSDDDGWVSRDLMVPLLNRGAGIFYAHMARDRGDPFVFAVDPYDAEEVSLYRRAEGKGRRRETVVRFHKRSDYETGRSIPQEALDLVVADRYDVETTVQGNLDVVGRTTVHMAVQAEGHPWVPFSLYHELRVDSVTWSDGTPAPFARGKEAADVWVDVSGAPSRPAELTFHYRGPLLERPTGLWWLVMKSTSGWYPMHQYGRAATYRLAFHTPEKYAMAAVGRLVSEERTGDVVTRVYETPPVHQVTFNIGEFQTTTRPAGAGPELTVQVSTKAHNRLSDDMYDAGYLLHEQNDMAGTVGRDLETSFAFFNQAFGPTPVKAFTATEILSDHGEAYPGLVLLSLLTFQTTSEEGYSEMFRAHEVAHQWWGIGVRPATYHDRWLAEGFSEFSGLWYMARVRGSIDLYEKRLKESREALLKRRDEAAPIWLGTRAGTSKHPEDYALVVYKKGAWVLHMLRDLLIDWDGGNEDVFDTLMRDFYATHLGEAVTTEQFLTHVETHVGQSMQWFFDQWVYGSAIPTYVFSHRLEEQADGQWKAFVRVRQERVPDDFQMVVPVLLDFGEAGTAVVKLLVSGPLTEAELPLLPMKPERVEFNPFEAVLAETKTEGWKGG